MFVLCVRAAGKQREKAKRSKKRINRPLGFVHPPISLRMSCWAVFVFFGCKQTLSGRRCCDTILKSSFPRRMNPMSMCVAFVLPPLLSSLLLIFFPVCLLVLCCVVLCGMYRKRGVCCAKILLNPDLRFLVVATAWANCSFSLLLPPPPHLLLPFPLPR